jgi:predicted DNA-binding protein YlxM (UPF0122 family)
MKSRPVGRPRKLYLDAREILNAYQSGMSLGEIAQPYGVTRQAVSARLRYYGAETLKRGRRKGIKYQRPTIA